MELNNTEKQVRESLQIEDAMDASSEEKGPHVHHIKLDANGLPLVPQPSDHKDDPLVCILRFSPSQGEDICFTLLWLTPLAELVFMVQILCPVHPLSPGLHRTM